MSNPNLQLCLYLLSFSCQPPKSFMTYRQQQKWIAGSIWDILSLFFISPLSVKLALGLSTIAYAMPFEAPGKTINLVPGLLFGLILLWQKSGITYGTGKIWGRITSQACWFKPSPPIHRSTPPSQHLHCTNRGHMYAGAREQGAPKVGQRKIQSDLIVTNIAISVNKSALLVNKSALSVRNWRNPEICTDWTLVFSNCPNSYIQLF